MRIKGRSYYLIMVNDIIVDYSLIYGKAVTIATGYKKASPEFDVEILEVISKQLYSVKI